VANSGIHADLFQLQADPAEFRNSLLIDTDQGPQPFGECMGDFQKEDFAALDAGWLRCVNGADVPARHSRAWLERGRGSSKTLDLAVAATWALFASRRQLSGIAAAGDQDQARLLRDAIARICWMNPWLTRILQVNNYIVRNTKTGSNLEIISSDAGTSYGLTPDFVIVDEIVHWQHANGEELWTSLLSSSAKRDTNMLVIITNAGMTDDWQWKLREKVRLSNAWFFHRLDRPAGWITDRALKEQEALLPSIAYRRLWLNEWTTGGGDALTEEVINAAFIPHLTPQQSAQSGYEYVGGLDLGVSRDASAVCILGVRRSAEGHGRIRLAFTRVWRPSRNQKVNLQEVEDTLRELHARFHLKALHADPWQASHMLSRLQAGGLSVQSRVLTKYRGQLPSLAVQVPTVEVPQTGINLQKMATVVIESFNDHRLELFPDEDLKRDVTRFRIEERSYGFRLVSPRDSIGHGDLGTAFCHALLGAYELAGKRKIIAGSANWGDPIDPDTDPLGATPLAMALREFDFSRQMHDREQQLAMQPTDHQAGFKQLMARTFRCYDDAFDNLFF
jgi:phage terminase large subunit-like protein